MLKNLYVSVLLGFALLGILEAKISFPQVAHASDLWTSKQPDSHGSTAVLGDNDLAKINLAFTDLAAKASPAVVNIYTKSGIPGPRNFRQRHFQPGDEDFEFFFGNPMAGPPGPRIAQALGSGFVINRDGFIVTNAHVVTIGGRPADEIMVKFNGEDGDKGHAAKVVGFDETSDVALLKLVEKKTDLHIIPLGDSDQAKVGEWVFAIGNPYGHTNTVTQGIVSALGRNLEGAHAEFMQTSASINPGNSGGPLINLAGEVVGINSAIDPRAQGIGFAIPINSAKSVITQLMEKGKVAHGWMGLAIQDINDDMAGALHMKNSEGVLVKDVVPDQPASQAGISAYDVITAINGKAVKNSNELVRSIDNLAIGQTAEVRILHENQIRDVKVRVAEKPTRS